jgi:hypothetical protein
VRGGGCYTVIGILSHQLTTWLKYESCRNIHAQFQGLFRRFILYSYNNPQFDFIGILLPVGTICLMLNCFFSLIPYPTLNISGRNRENCFFVKIAYLTENTQAGDNVCHSKQGVWARTSHRKCNPVKTVAMATSSDSLVHSHQGYYVRYKFLRRTLNFPPLTIQTSTLCL